MNFSSKWITTSDFYGLDIINLFHRQFDKIEIPESPIKNYHVHIRKKFTLDDFTEAFINISADDYYKLYINGKFVAQGPEAAYIDSFAYNKIDISSYLNKGENIIAVHLHPRARGRQWPRWLLCAAGHGR